MVPLPRSYPPYRYPRPEAQQTDGGSMRPDALFKGPAGRTVLWSAATCLIGMLYLPVQPAIRLGSLLRLWVMLINCSQSH